MEQGGSAQITVGFHPVALKVSLLCMLIQTSISNVDIQGSTNMLMQICRRRVEITSWRVTSSLARHLCWWWAGGESLFCLVSRVLHNLSRTVACKHE